MSSTKIPNIAELRDIILELLQKEKLEDSHYVEILDYCLEKFGELNLNRNYYGYHNLSHELVVTNNTLLAARGSEFKELVSSEDFKHLFVAALFHDYDPDKEQDKPREIEASEFVVSDNKLQMLFKKAEIDPHLVALLILRTTYPWKLKRRELEPLLRNHFSKSKYSDDEEKQKHYLYLGWFMSVADRMGAYALGDFLDAIELAKKNSHSLGWDPEYLIRRSVLFFETLLNDEHEMADKVMRSIPKSMRKTFMENVMMFYKLRQKELEVKAAISYEQIELVANIENIANDRQFGEILFDIFDELPDPLQFKKTTFFESLNNPKTILVTLRLGSDTGEIIGFAKGAPLEEYSLPKDIKDENIGKHNSVFLEPLAIKAGYWGHGGGSKMRKVFRKFAKEKKYVYLTGLQLREVIQNRINREDKIEFVQQLDPEKLDYYRVTL